MTSLWKDTARTQPTTADADQINAWDDLSGNGNHLLSSGADGPFRIDSAFLDGRRTLLFLASSSTVLAKAFTLVQPAEIMLRMGTGSGTVNNAHWIDGFGGNSMAFFQSGTGPTKVAMYAGVELQTSNVRTNDALVTIRALFNGVSSEIDYNGTLTTGSAGTTGPGGLTLGRFGGGGFFADAWFRKIVVCNAALTAAERVSLAAYLAS